MRNSHPSGAKRFAAGAMGLLMLLVVLFSAFCIAAEADHDCTGEDCLICACIRQCENTLREFCAGTAACLSAVAPVNPVLLAAAFAIAAVSQDTLISRKVRLNN